MDKDIQEMFSKKNREILINNLNLDVERSIEVLKNTVLNIYEKEFESASRNIKLMYSDSYFDGSLKKVDTLLSKLKLSSYNQLCFFIDKKMDDLCSNIDILVFDEDNMNKYYDIVFNSTNQVIDYFKSDEFCLLRKNSINDFYLYSKSKLKDEMANITNSRINDYITYRLFGKIEERIKSEFLIRDNNLKNKGIESYNKYQELQKKTTNV